MNWNDLIESEQKKPYFKKLEEFLKKEYDDYVIYPPQNQIFAAFNLTPFEEVRVVVLGQDPYYRHGQANGLAFSVESGVKVPPSLRNIYKLLGNEGDLNGDLTYLAKQGVLLLNTVLTVREGEADSHKNIGWENFTNQVIFMLNKSTIPIVFMLWGNNAIKKEKLITNNVHLVLKAPHPSPLSAYNGFFTCDHPRLCNEFLQQCNRGKIVWSGT